MTARAAFVGLFLTYSKTEMFLYIGIFKQCFQTKISFLPLNNFLDLYHSKWGMKFATQNSPLLNSIGICFLSTNCKLTSNKPTLKSYTHKLWLGAFLLHLLPKSCNLTRQRYLIEITVFLTSCIKTE